MEPAAGLGGHGGQGETERGPPYCAPRAWGVPPPPDFAALWRTATPVKAICIRYGVTEDRVTSWRKALGLNRRPPGRPGLKWPQWRYQAFRAAWLRGDSGKAMADRFGLTDRAVFNLRLEMGLPSRRVAPAEPAPPGLKSFAPPADAMAVVSPSIQVGKTDMARPERVRECQFVISGPPWLYCDAPTERGRSMCEAHRAQCLARAA